MRPAGAGGIPVPTVQSGYEKVARPVVRSAEVIVYPEDVSCLRFFFRTLSLMRGDVVQRALKMRQF